MTVDESGDEVESSPPAATIMVPMADLLNHVPQHNGELNLGESTFRMIAVKDIKKVIGWYLLAWCRMNMYFR